MSPSPKKSHPLRDRVIRFLTTNLWLKLLSVVLAILLWVIVVYSDTSITRSRTFTGLGALLNGQQTLTGNSLALIENPLNHLSGITVELEVPLANYSQVNENNVRVWLDLSSIRTAGTQRVPLSATSTYGRVSSIYPASVEVQVEALDSRSVPLNASLTGRSDDYWYNVSSMNPATLTVSGASSIVQNVAMARIQVDVSGMKEATTRAYPFVLLDYSGNEVSQEVLARTSASVTAAIEVFPTKELAVSQDIEDLITGQVASGYRVESVEISPATITVAAEQSLLDGLTEIAIEPVDVDALDRSFTLRRPISKLSNIRYFSADQVYVTVNVVEAVDSVAFSDVPVVPLNTPDGLEILEPPETVNVRVTGVVSQISDLTPDMLQATVDLSQATAGAGGYPVMISVPGRPDLTFEVTPSLMPVTLGERSSTSEEGAVQ